MRSIDQREEISIEAQTISNPFALTDRIGDDAAHNHIPVDSLGISPESYNTFDGTDPVGIWRAWISRYPAGLTFEQQQIAFNLLLQQPDAPVSILQNVSFLGESPKPNKDGVINEKEALRYRQLQTVLAESTTIKEAIYKSNLGLAFHFAYKYGRSGLRYGMAFEDVIQFANMGLEIAVDRFDVQKRYTDNNGEERPYRFSTYAGFWIRQAVTRGVIDTSRTIKIPPHVHGAVQRVRRERAQYYRTHGHYPTRSELYELLDDSETNIESVLNVYFSGIHQPTESLDLPTKTDDSEGATVGEFIPDPKINIEEEGLSPVYLTQLKEQIDASLNELDERTRLVLEMRFGLNRERSYTLDEVAQVLGVSRQRISQIERIGIRHLRRSPLAYKFSDEEQKERIRAHIDTPPPRNRVSPVGAIRIFHDEGGVIYDRNTRASDERIY